MFQGGLKLNQLIKERAIVDRIVENVSKVIIGKERGIYNILKAVLAGGHVLIDDVPGVGKTTLVKALAKSLDLSYKRIQFTPDLLPSDIIGISVFNQREMTFEFKKGPVFSNIVLADEINRTSPKTQAALLEVMEENQISDGNDTYKLKSPFIVLATENPIEYQGTFPLPEAQLDRFMIKVKIGYPSKEAEEIILSVYREHMPLEDINAVASIDEILMLQSEVKKVKISEDITKFIVEIANSTRNSKYIALGVSTRGVLALQRICQATALIRGRNYVVPDDVKENLIMVLSHRILLSPLGVSNKYSRESIIEAISQRIDPPRVKFNDWN